MLTKEQLSKVYDTRFTEKLTTERYAVFKVLCTNFFDKFLPSHSKNDNFVVIDVAAGHCDFINNIGCNDANKYAFDLNDYIDKHAASYVKTINDNVANISNYFQEGSVDLIFNSNFLEHIEKPVIVKFLSDSYKLLKKGGEMWIMIPNIRYTGGAYWDYFDHITPLTERSIIEEGKTSGFEVKTIIKKFIPYSMNYSKKPRNPFIVKLYLWLMPLSGMFFGQQSFIILKKS